MTGTAVPMANGPGAAVTTRWSVGPGLTETVAVAVNVPPGFDGSGPVPVIWTVPLVLNVPVKVAVPVAMVTEPGSVAGTPLLVIVTSEAYVVSVLPNWSSAVRVNVSLAGATTTEDAGVSTSCVAEAAETTVVHDVPLMFGGPLKVASTVSAPAAW